MRNRRSRSPGSNLSEIHSQCNAWRAIAKVAALPLVAPEDSRDADECED
jgi:hypothetical protein